MVASKRKQKKPRKYGGKKRGSYSRSSRYSRRAYSRGPYRALRPQVLPKYLYAQLNPFGPLSKGVRIPDANTASSVGCHSLETIPLNISSSGYLGAQLVSPIVRALYANVATNAASSVTWPNYFIGSNVVASSKEPSMTAQFDSYRPVAQGVRISCSVNSTTAQGYLHVGLMSLSETGATGLDGVNLPTTVSQMVDLHGYKRFTISSLTQEPVYICNRPTDASGGRYVDATTALGTATAVGPPVQTGVTFNDWNFPVGWMCIIIFVEGSTGTSPVTLDIITHWEGQLKPGSLPFDKPAEDPNQRVLDLTARVLSRADVAWQGEMDGCVKSIFGGSSASKHVTGIPGVTNLR